MTFAGVGAKPLTTPANSAPFVSVLIVNYNGRHFLDDCLRSLENQTYPASRREVIVVDNGSTDGSVGHLQEHYPSVLLLVAGKNLGFAGANNLGIRHARGDLIALLNNDTVAEPGWLEGLVAEVQRDPRTGAVTSKILFRDEPGVINSVGLNLYRDGRGGDRGFRQPDAGQYDEPAEVFGACGASVLLRRELLDDVGLFDERFFMYYEDLDLAWRARLRGWKFRYTPASVVHHVHCGTSGEWSPFFLYHVERNRVFVSVKNGPWRLALRSLAVFGARGIRKWFRVAVGIDRTRTDLRQALAYLPAGVSLVFRLPEMLAKRFAIRTRRRRVSDRDLAPLISAPPARR